jgi:hypothetical protein
MKKSILKIVSIALISMTGFMSNAQDMTFVLMNDSVITGPTSADIALYGTIYNNTSSDILVQADRLENNIPTDWNTAFCLDFCLPPHIGQGSVLIPANSNQLFTIHFYTAATNNSANVYMRFLNTANPSNIIYQRFYGNSDQSLSSGAATTRMNQRMKVYPNPFKTSALIEIPGNGKNSPTEVVAEIYDMTGKVIRTEKHEVSTRFILDRKNLPAGIYYMTVRSEKQIIASGRFSVN